MPIWLNIYTAVVIPRSKQYTPQQGANKADNHDNFFFTKYMDYNWVLLSVCKKKIPFIYTFTQYERVLIGIHPQFVYICTMSVHSNRRCLPVRALNAAASVSAAPSTAIIDPRGGRRAHGGGACRTQLKYLLRVSKKKKP